jgi:hypothetical protein
MAPPPKKIFEKVALMFAAVRFPPAHITWGQVSRSVPESVLYLNKIGYVNSRWFTIKRYSGPFVNWKVKREEFCQ